MTDLRKEGLRVVSLVPLVALLAFGLRQYGAYRDERDRLSACLAVDDARLARARAAVGRIAQLREETRRVELDIERLEGSVLPRTLGPDAYLLGVREKITRFGGGLEVLENDFREKDDGILLQGDLSVAFYGSHDRIEAFLRTVPSWARLSSWKEIAPIESGTLGVLTTWALPLRPEPPRAQRDPCQAASRRGLWPFSDRVRPLDARHAAAGRDLEQLAAVTLEVESFERRRARLQALVDTINALATRLGSWDRKP